MATENGDMLLVKFFSITSFILNILLWVFVITTNDIKGIALDKAESIERNMEVLESRLDAVEECHRIDTVVVNMCIQDYVKVKNNIKK